MKSGQKKLVSGKGIKYIYFPQTTNVWQESKWHRGHSQTKHVHDMHALFYLPKKFTMEPHMIADLILTHFQQFTHVIADEVEICFYFQNSFNETTN